MAPSLKVNEAIKDIIFLQLLDFAQSGGLDLFGRFVETAVETGLLGDAFKGTVNIAGPHFGIVFSFLDGNFPFQFSVFVLESLIEYLRLSFLKVVLRDNFF